MFTVLVEAVHAALDTVCDVRESVAVVARNVGGLAEAPAAPKLTPPHGLPRVLAEDPHRRFSPVLGDHQPVGAVHAERRDVEELPGATPAQVRRPRLLLLSRQAKVVHLPVQYKNVNANSNLAAMKEMS